jgi:hypothetical protein
MPIDVVNADAVAEGILPHAKSTSGTGTHIIDSVLYTPPLVRAESARTLGIRELSEDCPSCPDKVQGLSE